MMDELAFWKQKIIQAFHDPPGKPYAFFPKSGGHFKLAQRLFKVFTDEALKYYPGRPDLAASGADRPVMNGPRGKAELNPGSISFHLDNIVTHPLAGSTLRLPAVGSAQPVDDEEAEGAKPESTRRPKLRDILELFAEQEEVLRTIGPVEWNDPSSLHDGFFVIWRRFRDELALAFPKERLLWERVPGDSRVPDHSIWEHTKVASALAFLDRGSKQKVPPEKEPWLFTFSLTPVQEFIEHSRKSRDLWISSFLLSELAWAAMLPIVEHYGPDAIVYPDLRGNPRVDHWLKYQWSKGKDVDPLPRGAYPHTHAALLPETFVAIIPRGGAGHLKTVETMAAKCSASMTSRWAELAQPVRSWLVKKTTDAPGWTEIWDRQHRAPPITSFWSAVHWWAPEKVDNKEELKLLHEGGALPAQDERAFPAPLEKTLQAAHARTQRLAPWTTPEVWAHYEKARSVFGQVNLGYLQNERGFDYALTHHQLRMRQRARKQEASYHTAPTEEPGEKCTLCKQRQALYDMQPGDAGAIDQLRQQVKKFWSRKELDEEQTGAERLCGICAFKRFLVEAGGNQGINPVWCEPRELASQLNGGGKVRFPFPSTSAIATQEFLAAVAESKDPAVQNALEEVVRAHRQTERPRTLFAETLPRLQAASKASGLAKEFLQIEPQESCVPEALQSSIERERDAAKRDPKRDPAMLQHLMRLHSAAKELRRAASEAKKTGDASKREIEDPCAHFALVRIDGDHLGKLLVGDAEAIGARWRDVIHPRTVQALADKPKLSELWASLLEAPRLMGPSLHAFISRALADFSHRIVPWVVEQEYGGRLIYSGGDDVLAMVPARDALLMTARLQQLYSAAWIVDTMPEVTAWSWRSSAGNWRFNPVEARKRFMIPKPVPTEAVVDRNPLKAIELPLKAESCEVPVGLSSRGLPIADIDGHVLAGLGPSQSLSASIVYGHFKTQLSTMLKQGSRLLDEVAKNEVGRGAVAMAHHSRGGLKTEIALKWRLRSENHIGGNTAAAHELMQRVITGFQSGELPQRLPYKLRELSPLLLVAGGSSGESQPEGQATEEADQARVLALARGLLAQSVEKKPPDEIMDAALQLWLAGYEHGRRRASLKDGDATERIIDAEKFTDALLLCRYLAGHGGDDE